MRRCLSTGRETRIHHHQMFGSLGATAVGDEWVSVELRVLLEVFSVCGKCSVLCASASAVFSRLWGPVLSRIFGFFGLRPGTRRPEQRKCASACVRLRPAGEAVCIVPFSVSAPRSASGAPLGGLGVCLCGAEGHPGEVGVGEEPFACNLPRVRGPRSGGEYIWIFRSVLTFSFSL